jgi:hypothetical protein
MKIKKEVNESPGLLTRSLWTHKFLHETVKLWYNSTIKQ